MIRVLICEDSPTSRALMIHILNSDPEMRVVGTVNNGEAAISAVIDKKPNIVMMDVHMPKMDGFEATRRIMNTSPLPIIIVSSTLNDQAIGTFNALEAGALAFIQHPPAIDHPDHLSVVKDLLLMIRLMSEIKVVRRWVNRDQLTSTQRIEKSTDIKLAQDEVKLIAIGASTGGPIVLQSILSAIAPDLTCPVLIVQHIAPGFVEGLAELLGSCGLPIHIATDAELMLPGHVYIAPEDWHMGIDRKGKIKLDNSVSEHGMRPSVSHLFRSVANVAGSSAIGILLTGMGRDGAEELKLMRDQGALTIAQDEQSSVVYGMPGEASRLDAADHVLPPSSIATMLNQLFKNEKRKS